MKEATVGQARSLNGGNKKFNVENLENGYLEDQYNIKMDHICEDGMWMQLA
jgi:hypothetical protein